MATLNYTFGSTFIFLLLPLLLQFYSGKSDLQLNYYSESCPRAEEIIKEQSCDASLLLDTINGIESEKTSSRSFGMRNFKYINTIKDALENECPMTVSCADIVSLSARDGAVMSKTPSLITMTPSLSLSTFQSIGIDTEGTVALLGYFKIFYCKFYYIIYYCIVCTLGWTVHCTNIVQRLYPTVDPSLDPDYAEYLKKRCPSPYPDPKAVEYARNDRETPMYISICEKMAADNGYFHDQFSRALLILSENNPLTGDEGEVRKDCRYLNTD
ncbi:hypothetical protein Pfo_028797 [Paulownia fortunei]|nr:hypothetical protein Pfo_028797 [Paulownia fortunei]